MTLLPARPCSLTNAPPAERGAGRSERRLQAQAPSRPNPRRPVLVGLSLVLASRLLARAAVACLITMRNLFQFGTATGDSGTPGDIACVVADA